jgi:RimJ/RimL family protein N-acetyltransferase
LYGDGSVKSDAWVEARVQIWVSKWEKQDPFSAFAIFLREATNTFVGHIVLGLSDRASFAELAYAILPEFWGQGLTTEAAAFIVNEYATRLQLQGRTVAGCQFRGIIATAHVENHASNAILRKLYFTLESTSLVHAATRHTYTKMLA